MTAEKKEATAVKEVWLGYLKTTIGNTLRKLSEDKARVLTIQEVSKLIDVHEKLSDNQAGSKEFWEMLARIRKDGLAGKHAAAPPAPSKKRTTGRRKS